MQITSPSSSSYTLKAKSAAITVNEHIQINEHPLPGPGEYEVSEVFAEVMPDLALFHADGLVVASLLNGKRTVTAEEVEHLEDVDILCLVAGSDSAADVDAIDKVVKDIEPRVVVIAGGDPASYQKLEGHVPDAMPALKLTKSDLPEESRRVYVLAS
ncbi:hypothetical protein HY375_02820 [Candidatus Berkelbacteria bacterium]|nr:hypothetical protein [Candidatus Berkelbacteria bacterium]